MKKVRVGLLVISIITPQIVFASDPTPLFVFFIEVPLLILSLVFLIGCYLKPKVGLALTSIHILSSLFVSSWAEGVGYMDDAGGILLLSIVVDVFGIVVASKKSKIHFLGEKSTEDSSKTISLSDDNYIPIEEFSKLKGMQKEEIIVMVKDGHYIGRLIQGKWHIHKSEL